MLLNCLPERLWAGEAAEGDLGAGAVVHAVLHRVEGQDVAHEGLCAGWSI